MEIHAAIISIPKALRTFWTRYPALLYGLGLLLGCSLALIEAKIALLIPTLLLFGPLWRQAQGICALIVMLSSTLYCYQYYHAPALPDSGVMGTAHIKIQSISNQETLFGTVWALKGTVYSFLPRDESVGNIARGLPYRMTISSKGSHRRPEANKDYKVEARLKRMGQGTYQLSVSKDAVWKALSFSWSSAEMRYQAKETVGNYIRNHMLDARAANFLVGLVTGDFFDQQTRQSLGRFGLQHILAVSGFHFAILAGLTGMILTAVFPFRIASMLLIAILSAYCVFLGYGPSIMRAWLAITIGLTGQLCSRRSSGLNSMGIAMIIILVYDPLASTSIAFHLSFLATAAILLLMNPIDRWLMSWWPKRATSVLLKMNYLDQHGYLLLTLGRQALALTLAVHVVTMPVCLWHFEQFPLLSIPYNVFFPCLVSGSMILLLLAVVSHVVSTPLADSLHGKRQIRTG